MKPAITQTKADNILPKETSTISTKAIQISSTTQKATINRIKATLTLIVIIIMANLVGLEAQVGTITMAMVKATVEEIQNLGETNTSRTKITVALTKMIK